MKEKSKILECALEGIQLSEDEVRLVEWITGWDLWTVQQFSQIVACLQRTGKAAAAQITIRGGNNMLPFVETICKLIYRILRIVFGLFLCTKFFLGNREESHTLWYGIACLILFI